MLLTISTTHSPATDLGYLLHKNPARLHSLEVSFGKAHVFYPEASEEKCTAALLLDVDPVALVRGKRGQHEGGTLDQYVNDRPFLLSSFLGVALARLSQQLAALNQSKLRSKTCCPAQASAIGGAWMDRTSRNPVARRRFLIGKRDY